MVDLQFAQARLQRLVGQHRVAQGHAHIAQHGGIGQVALPAADRQFFAQMAQKRVGQAQIAFGVLKINGVNLVRHGARTHFAVAQLLLEIAQRHIAPNVARPVDQNGVGACHSVKQLGHVVVRLDLDAVGLKAQAQAQGLGRLDHTLGKGFPVKIGPGRQVRVVVAHGAVHLAQDFDVGDFFNGRLQAHHHVGNFLAHGGGAGGLAVGAAEHGHVGKSMGHVAQLEHQAVELGQQHHVARHAQLQGVAGVVDVFAGAGKVHKLTGGQQLGARFKLGL